MSTTQLNLNSIKTLIENSYESKISKKEMALKTYCKENHVKISTLGTLEESVIAADSNGKIHKFTFTKEGPVYKVKDNEILGEMNLTTASGRQEQMSYMAEDLLESFLRKDEDTMSFLLSEITSQIPKK